MHTPKKIEKLNNESVKRIEIVRGAKERDRERGRH